jgi:peptide/nickel transport system permease protein
MSTVLETPARPSRWARFADSDLWYSFRRSPTAIVASVIALLCLVGAVFANWLAPHNPFDLATLDLLDARLPPAWIEGGSTKYLFGTDDQGRDILSALMYGSRISLFVGLASVVLSVLIGVGLGLLAGFAGGAIDAFIMRVCDVMLSFPAILVALLIDGLGRALFPNAHELLAFSVLVIAIALTGWVQYARTVRGSTMVERNKEYVQAARVITEATLSFLGVGVPPTSPSLGTLIRIGQDFLFSGEWWITVFPGLMLVMIALSVNLLGDWLRDALNPRLR